MELLSTKIKEIRPGDIFTSKDYNQAMRYIEDDLMKLYNRLYEERSYNDMVLNSCSKEVNFMHLEIETLGNLLKNILDNPINTNLVVKIASAYNESFFPRKITISGRTIYNTIGQESELNQIYGTITLPLLNSENKIALYNREKNRYYLPPDLKDRIELKIEEVPVKLDDTINYAFDNDLNTAWVYAIERDSDNPVSGSIKITLDEFTSSNLKSNLIEIFPSPLYSYDITRIVLNDNDEIKVGNQTLQFRSCYPIQVRYTPRITKTVTIHFKSERYISTPGENKKTFFFGFRNINILYNRYQSSGSFYVHFGKLSSTPLLNESNIRVITTPDYVESWGTITASTKIDNINTFPTSTGEAIARIELYTKDVETTPVITGLVLTYLKPQS